MSRSRSAVRTQPCTKTQARTRLEHSRKFLEVAEMTAGEAGDVEYASAAAALVEQVAPGGDQAANALRRLLNLKDEAQYGFFDVGGHDLQSALRQAKTLLDFATGVVQRQPA